VAGRDGVGREKGGAEEGLGRPAASFTRSPPLPILLAFVDGEIKQVSLKEYTAAGKYVVVVWYPKVSDGRV
jgi:hypothetical protein